MSEPRKRRRTGGKELDPEFTHERARKAGIASHSLDVYVASVVKRAPELTPAQRQALAAILHPHTAGQDGGQREAS